MIAFIVTWTRSDGSPVEHTETTPVLAMWRALRALKAGHSNITIRVTRGAA